jgi:hypothetical protein
MFFSLIGRTNGFSEKNPYSNKCKICTSKINGVGHYCHDCAYKKGKIEVRESVLELIYSHLLGICSMCGRKILDTTMYKQTK